LGNENLIDVLVRPTVVGQPASFTQRPMTATYSVSSQFATVAADDTTSIEIAEPSPGTLVVTGQIAAGTQATLVTKRVDDPSACWEHLAGYVQTKSGRHVTLMIVLGNMPVDKPADVVQVADDQARILDAVYKDL
jgi:D-alanyl-D-alanine carboxypeptidase